MNCFIFYIYYHFLLPTLFSPTFGHLIHFSLKKFYFSISTYAKHSLQRRRLCNLLYNTLRNLGEIIKGQFPFSEYWKLRKWKYLDCFTKKTLEPGNKLFLNCWGRRVHICSVDYPGVKDCRYHEFGIKVLRFASFNVTSVRGGKWKLEQKLLFFNQNNKTEQERNVKM